MEPATWQNGARRPWEAGKKGRSGPRRTQPSARPQWDGCQPDPTEEGRPVPGVMEAEQNAASFHREAEDLRPRGGKHTSRWAC